MDVPRGVSEPLFVEISDTASCEQTRGRRRDSWPARWYPDEVWPGSESGGGVCWGSVCSPLRTPLTTRCTHPPSSVLVSSLRVRKAGQESGAGAGSPGHWSGGGGRAGVQERGRLDRQGVFELNFEGW